MLRMEQNSMTIPSDDQKIKARFGVREQFGGSLSLALSYLDYEKGFSEKSKQKYRENTIVELEKILAELMTLYMFFQKAALAFCVLIFGHGRY
jgi:hypothetical protein